MDPLVVGVALSLLQVRLGEVLVEVWGGNTKKYAFAMNTSFASKLGQLPTTVMGTVMSMGISTGVWRISGVSKVWTWKEGNLC